MWDITFCVGDFTVKEGASVIQSPSPKIFDIGAWRRGNNGGKDRPVIELHSFLPPSLLGTSKFYRTTKLNDIACRLRVNSY